MSGISEPTRTSLAVLLALSGPRHVRRQGTIRNAGVRAGRNDPCPCKSGRKFKACCLKANDAA